MVTRDLTLLLKGTGALSRTSYREITHVYQHPTGCFPVAGGDLDSCFRLLLAFRGSRESKVDRSALMTTPEILERVL